MKSILLINPPLTKPCEPPAGIAKLAGFLRSNGIDCRVYDASIDGILGLLDQPQQPDDTWTKRAHKHLQTHLDSIRSLPLYNHRDRYKRAVMDINRLLSMKGRSHDANLSLGNYTSPHLSPVRSADLLQAAETYSDNPFFSLYSRSLSKMIVEWEPDFFGISINFMSQALSAFYMMGFIKKRFPGKNIVCGGGLVTSWLEIPGWQNPLRC